MNLAIRGIDSSNVKWNNEGSFLNDAHKDLKADYIIANPPFNDSDWSGELLRDDARWKYGVPPNGNANYGWIQHFLYHLAPSGNAGFVLAKGSLSIKTGTEGDIRTKLIENDLIDCIVNLPTKLFLNTQIPACLWFMQKGKTKRKGEVLFIDARNYGYLVNRRNRALTDDDITAITQTYHNWLNGAEATGESEYNDIDGFCKSATLQEIADKKYVLTPGRYIGLPDEEDDFNFAERFATLRTALEKQMQQEVELNKRITANLAKIEYTKE